MKTALIAAVVVLACAAALWGAEDEPETLTVRTTDGLILVSGAYDELKPLSDRLAADAPAKRSTAETLLMLKDSAVPADGIQVFFSGGTASPANKPAPRMMALADAVREGIVPDVIGLEIYDALTLLRMNGVEGAVLGEPPAKSHLAGKASVSLRSSMVGLRPSRIFVNGKSYKPSSVGYTLVVMAPGGSGVVASRSFNTYESPDENDRMADFLREQPAGAVLVGVSFLGSGVFMTTAADALREYGLLVPINPEVPTSHAFIGVKGLPPGGGVEATANNQDSTIVLLAEDLYVRESEIGGFTAHPGGLAAVLSGTEPGSTVYVFQ
ncbi:MAG: interleukin-like EMT inducer domain-containing protein [bacterium]